MSLKVLMFGWELAPIVHGGLGVVCRSIVDNLITSDVEVTYVVPKLPKELFVDNLNLVNASQIILQDEKFNYKTINTLITPYASFSSYSKEYQKMMKVLNGDDNNDMYAGNLYLEIDKYAERAKDIARNSDFNVIHAHDWMTFKAGVFAKQVTGKPLILHVHATEYDRSAGNPNPAVLDAERFGFQNADKIIAVSNKTKDKVVNLYGVDPSIVEVVHNAVHIKDAPSIGTDYSAPISHSIKHDDKIVLFLARLTVQKGADFLLKSAQKVLEHMDNVKFVFVGKGEMLQELIDLSIDLGIADNVIFTGFLDYEQVDRAYKQADLFVMPSIAEPFGITALEAIRNGTPVLLSKQSGAGEVIKNCLKVDFWDVDQMAEKILSVLRYSPLHESLSENAYTDLDAINWADQTDKIIEIYHKLV